MKIVRRLIVAAIFLQPLLLSASPWKFSESVQWREVYTNNMLLSVNGEEESELVSEVQPGVVLTGDGAQTKFHLDYSLQVLNYKKHSEQNDEFHQMNFSLSRALLDDNISMDFRGRYGQQAIQGQSGVAADNIFLAGNRTDVATYQISPRASWRFKPNNIDLLILPSYTEVKYQDVDGFDSKMYEIRSVLEDDPTNRETGWRLSAQQQTVDYESGDYVELSRVDYGITIPVGKRTDWLVNAGWERNQLDYSGQVTIIRDTLWNTGMNWNPTVLTSFTALYGKRFYGDTYYLESRHRGKYLLWSIDYKEELDTNSSQQQTQLSADQTQGQTTLPEISNQTLTNELFTLKTLRTTVSYTRARTIIGLNLSKANREFVLSGEEEDLASLMLNYNRRIAGRTRVSILGMLQKSSFSVDGREDKLKEITLEANHSISKKIDSRFSMSRSLRDSNQSNRNYSTNVYSIHFTMNL